jgi:hypothetical protein
MHDEKLVERSVNILILEIFLMQTLLPRNACQMRCTLPHAFPQEGKTLVYKFRKLGRVVA